MIRWNVFIYKRFREISREVGSDIIHLQVFGFHVVVCNSKQVADDLLDKRSSIYSGRPRMPMMNELVGFGWSLAFRPYGQFWKDARRLFHRHFQPSQAAPMRPKMLRAVHRVLRQLAERPRDLTAHLKLMAASVFLDIGYGIQAERPDDAHIVRAQHALSIIDQLGNPGEYLVDIIPALKHVPSWMPGAGFKRKAHEWRKVARNFYNLPFERVKQEMARGTAAPSFTSLALRELGSERGPERDHEEELIKTVAATLYVAATDTMISTMRTFFLAMSSNPAVLQRAQAEIDSVVGRDRLPAFDDEVKLPYVSALVKEVMRWQQVAPFGVPHCSSADDVYRGYFIPKGSLVIGNAWAILHDEALYSDPFAFRPERFLGPNVDPRALAAVDYAFGFGRRMCPGRFIASSFIWVTIAHVLATFDIAKPVGADGKPVETEVAYSGGIMGFPEEFECTIVPRSTEALELIRATA